jgi:hypothetical protein
MIVLESGNNVIQLKSPDFHQETLQQKVTAKRTMNGAFRTNIQTPCNRRFDVEVLILSITKRREFEAFLDAVVGNNIKYTDKNGVVHTPVQLVTDPVSIDQVRANRYTSTFTLEDAF